MKRSRNFLTLLLLLLAGALIGGVIGEALSVFVPVLNQGITLGLDAPVNLDLWIVSLVFGFTLKLNVAGAIGLILALLWFRNV